MELRAFGNTGWQVPAIGQGTWRMERDDRAHAIAALRRGLDLGMTHIDTAELYGDGRVEELVGEAIAGRREEVFLVSKVRPENASYAGTLDACSRSLRRLRTDRLDVYLLHWMGPHPLEQTIEAFEALRGAGKIRAWGVSNFECDDLAEAERIAGGAAPIACNQVSYHLEDRGPERYVLPWCEARGVAVVGYSPFGAGRFLRDVPAARAALAHVASARGVSARQVALAYLLRHPLTFAIPKSARAAHVAENAAASGLALSAEEIARIDAAAPLE
jgi:diketogulonate reductase-like aldo/keto reductase